jgi:hypothetical protein
MIQKNHQYNCVGLTSVPYNIYRSQTGKGIHPNTQRMATTNCVLGITLWVSPCGFHLVGITRPS